MHLSSCKNLPPTFSMVHLLHPLYGVDAPVLKNRKLNNAVLQSCY